MGGQVGIHGDAFPLGGDPPVEVGVAAGAATLADRVEAIAGGFHAGAGLGEGHGQAGDDGIDGVPDGPGCQEMRARPFRMPRHPPR